MKIFLISGKAGSGKNEVANIIKENLENTVITSFSKYIKLFTLEFTDWDGRDITKPRDYLQNLGDTIRNIDENFLIKRLIEDLKIYETKFENVIISDVRLSKEIEDIKKYSGHEVVTIRINSETTSRKLNETEKNHYTELDLDGYHEFDYIIVNKFDDNLKTTVLDILERMNKNES